jgi:hypothetical protein
VGARGVGQLGARRQQEVLAEGRGEGDCPAEDLQKGGLLVEASLVEASLVEASHGEASHEGASHGEAFLAEASRPEDLQPQRQPQRQEGHLRPQNKVGTPQSQRRPRRELTARGHARRGAARRRSAGRHPPGGHPSWRTCEGTVRSCRIRSWSSPQSRLTAHVNPTGVGKRAIFGPRKKLPPGTRNRNEVRPLLLWTARPECGGGRSPPAARCNAVDLDQIHFFD